MLRALRWRDGVKTVLSATLPRQRLAHVASQPRCLSAVATETTTMGKDPVSTASSEANEVQKGAAGAGSAPVETDAMGIPRHTLLYEGSKRNIRISSSVTVVNGLYWSFYVGVLETQLPTTTWEPWGYLGLGLTAIMAAASHTFAKHWVSQISYLPDLRLLSIGTHNFFGVERMPRLVRLGGTIMPPIRPGAIYLTFKVRGDHFNSLLDSADGVFHDKEMLMKLLKASPNQKVQPSNGASEGSEESTTAAKTKKGKKRKRRLK